MESRATTSRCRTLLIPDILHDLALEQVARSKNLLVVAQEPARCELLPVRVNIFGRAGVCCSTRIGWPSCTTGLQSSLSSAGSRPACARWDRFALFPNDHEKSLVDCLVVHALAKARALVFPIAFAELVDLQ